MENAPLSPPARRRTATLFFAFGALRDLLRHHLIATPATYEKIAIAEAIHRAARTQDLAREKIQPLPDDDAMLVDADVVEAAAQAVAELSRGTALPGPFVACLTRFVATAPADGEALARSAELCLTHLSGILPADGGASQHAPEGRGRDLSLRDARTRLRWPPVRPRPSRYVPDRVLATDRSTPHQRLVAGLHSQIFMIEITAAEICAAIPLRFPEVPPELNTVLAEQTDDEGRHASVLLDAFSRRGGRIEAYDYSLALWERVQGATSLAEALCIEQVLGEGYCIGTDLCLVDAYRERGHADLVEIHRSIHDDEFRHALNGLTWFRRLAGQQAAEIIAKLEPRYAENPLQEPWFRADLRRMVGFSDAEIERQRQLACEFTPPD